MPFRNLERHKFGVIFADPPWHFRAGITSRHALNHYETMKLASIAALPVKDLAGEHCALFLWTTPPHLVQSLSVMRAWKFRYVSIAFTWVKLKKLHRDALFLDADMFVSMGHTTRKNSELCLLGKRGRPPRLSKAVQEVIISGRRQHSRKPDEAYRRAAELYPGPYLEMFSREPRDGWETWGIEAERGFT
jgi:N6-adenosine-specific RNA methylase IME4